MTHKWQQCIYAKSAEKQNINAHIISAIILNSWPPNLTLYCQKLCTNGICVSLKAKLKDRIKLFTVERPFSISFLVKRVNPYLIANRILVLINIITCCRCKQFLIRACIHRQGLAPPLLIKNLTSLSNSPKCFFSPIKLAWLAMAPLLIFFTYCIQCICFCFSR